MEVTASSRGRALDLSCSWGRNRRQHQGMGHLALHQPQERIGTQGTKLETYICFSRGAGRGCLCLGCEVPAGMQEVKVTGLCKGKSDTQVSGGGERYVFSLLSLPAHPMFSNSRSPQKARGFTGMTALDLDAQCNKGPSTSPSPSCGC